MSNVLLCRMHIEGRGGSLNRPRAIRVNRRAYPKYLGADRTALSTMRDGVRQQSE